MRTSETKLSELADLLAQLCDSELDRHEWERLDALLLDDAEAQEFYRRFIALDVDLAWRGAEENGDRLRLCDDQRCASVPASGPFGQKVPVPVVPRPASGACPPTPPLPPPPQS